MFRCVLALVVVLPCLVAVNGAIVQRDGTSTPSTYNAQTSSSPTSSYPTTSETSVTAPVSEKTSSTYSSSPTSTYPPTSSGTVVVPPTKSVPTTTPVYTCPHTVYQCASSGAPTETGSAPSSPSGTANCNGVQEWQSAFAYTAGNQVIYNNELFTALQWTYDNAPPAHPDQWSCGGVCAQPVNNQANCQGASAWQSSIAYNAGSKVTYNNHLWSAVQWVQSNAPGDESGSWKDLGLCGW